MRTLVAGTAGHVDHGKSALVQALTGTDPDRLEEEKARGITIDLGFAHADLGDGLTVSFIDVPGHERFIRNMLAGAHGLDAVVLVVAADESVMPQTREHFHICRMLGIPRGVVAITKCDAADAELQTLAEMEVRELVAGSFLEGAPIHRVSARTGAGLDALRDSLLALARVPTERPDAGPVVLPIDRAFTLRGFGTVVTGTLRAGTLRSGAEVELLPSGRRARVRGLHVHGAPTESVAAGSRAAANLAGVDLGEVRRGDVLCSPGALRASPFVDAELTLLEGARPLRDDTRVRVHLATAEVRARVRLLGTRELAGGGRAVVQLRLERPATAQRGQRLVIRAWSPAETIGGAVVLDPVPPRRKRSSADATVLTRLRDVEGIAAARVWLEEAGPRGLARDLVHARCGGVREALDAALRADPEVVALGEDGSVLVAAGALRALTEAAMDALSAFHAQNPLRSAMPREELRARVFGHAAAGAFERVLGAAAGSFRVATEGVALRGHEVRLSPEEERSRRAIVEAAAVAGLHGLDESRAGGLAGGDLRLAERVTRLLISDGALRRVGSALVDAVALDRLKLAVRARWPAGTPLDVGGFKEMTGLSRKFVIPLLEYLDSERVTRRRGAERVVLAEL